MTIITTQLDALWAVKVQDDRVIEARSEMQKAYATITVINARIQAIVNMGILDIIPTETKLVFNKAWGALKTCQTALEAADVQEALNWAGKL